MMRIATPAQKTPLMASPTTRPRIARMASSRSWFISTLLVFDHHRHGLDAVEPLTGRLDALTASDAATGVEAGRGVVALPPCLLAGPTTTRPVGRVAIATARRRRRTDGSTRHRTGRRTAADSRCAPGCRCTRPRDRKSVV